uniref:Uncharacterized protein n=1 Tax=Anguilla anguilla TaxID=7936 RepID=A0A0E9QRW7_ANGAN
MVPLLKSGSFHRTSGRVGKKHSYNQVLCTNLAHLTTWGQQHTASREGRQ